MNETPPPASKSSGGIRRCLGIVAAFHWEVRPLLQLAARREVRSSQTNARRPNVTRLDSNHYAFTLNCGPVLLVVAGAGADSSFRAAQLLAEKYYLRGLATIGFAGGLLPGLTAGDIIQSERVLDACNGEQFECQPGILPVRFNHSGSLLSVKEVVTTSTRKLHLGRKWGAAAVDMESAGVARAAAQAGLPFCAVKSITDPAEQSLSIDFNRCRRDDKGFSVWAIARQGMSSPRGVMDLWRLAGSSRRAAATLASAIAAAGNSAPHTDCREDVSVIECR